MLKEAGVLAATGETASDLQVSVRLKVEDLDIRSVAAGCYVERRCHMPGRLRESR